jgi:hypothetical protein
MCFPITLLMFSKSYLSNPLFWHTVAYLVSIDTRIKYPKAISATVGAKAEVLGEIPLFKATGILNQDGITLPSRLTLCITRQYHD